jgi:hypothetical protein
MTSVIRTPSPAGRKLPPSSMNLARAVVYTGSTDPKWRPKLERRPVQPLENCLSRHACSFPGGSLARLLCNLMIDELRARLATD